MSITVSQYEVAEFQEVRARMQMLLSRAIKADGADMGNIQVYDDATESLHMIIHQGLSEEFLKAFYLIKPFSPPSCGRAIGLGIPIIISDVQKDASLRAFLNLLKFRSVRSIPVLDHDRAKLGVLSTHSLKTDHPWNVDQSSPIVRSIAAALKELRTIANN